MRKLLSIFEIGMLIGFTGIIYCGIWGFTDTVVMKLAGSIVAAGLIGICLCFVISETR